MTRDVVVSGVNGGTHQLAERLAVTVAVDRAVLDPEDAVEAAAEPVRDLARDPIGPARRRLGPVSLRVEDLLAISVTNAVPAIRGRRFVLDRSRRFR